jgi:hypothetical protein
MYYWIHGSEVTNRQASYQQTLSFTVEKSGSSCLDSREDNAISIAQIALIDIVLVLTIRSPVAECEHHLFNHAVAQAARLKLKQVPIQREAMAEEESG